MPEIYVLPDGLGEKDKKAIEEAIKIACRNKCVRTRHTDVLPRVVIDEFKDVVAQEYGVSRHAIHAILYRG